jgi:hypothetical protein
VAGVGIPIRAIFHKNRVKYMCCLDRNAPAVHALPRRRVSVPPSASPPSPPPPFSSPSPPPSSALVSSVYGSSTPRRRVSVLFCSFFINNEYVAKQQSEVTLRTAVIVICTTPTSGFCPFFRSLPPLSHGYSSQRILNSPTSGFCSLVSASLVK